MRFASSDLGLAGVGASEPTSRFIVPVTRSVARRVSTEVAIASTGSPVRLKLTLRNRNGEPVTGGEALLQLQARGHLARFIEQLLPNAETSEFDGTLSVTAEGGQVVGTAIQVGSRLGEFTTLSVTGIY